MMDMMIDAVRRFDGYPSNEVPCSCEHFADVLRSKGPAAYTSSLNIHIFARFRESLGSVRTLRLQCCAGIQCFDDRSMMYNLKYLETFRPSAREPGLMLEKGPV